MKDQYIIHGMCEPRFKKVRQVFIENFKDGLETGASFAATINGEYVVDVWGGFVDPAKTKEWEKDTITNVFSTTKVMATLCVLLLADRGLIDLDAPVAKYWPEFAQAGKENIKVRWILSHSTGLSGFDQCPALETMYDWQKIIHMLEIQKPWWEPGAASGYHMVTFGYLAGELVRRVSGESIGRFFHEEIAVPLKADFHIGLSGEHDSRVAELIPPPPVPGPALDRNSIMFKTLFCTPIKPDCCDREWRAAEIPSSNGYGNARSVARIGSLLACGGELQGIRLLSGAVIDDAVEEQFAGTDLVMGVPVRWGSGFGLAGEDLEYLSKRTFYWGGFGGSWVEMDPDNRICFSYVMNELKLDPAGDRRMLALRNAFIEALKNEL